MRILHLIDTLDYNGSARQIRLLGPALSRDGVAVEICCLGPETPWSSSLTQAGVGVHALDWTRWFDPSVLWRLRDIVTKATPDVIHVWRLSALRALAIAAPGQLARVVMSAPLPAKGKLACWDRRLLQQVRCLAVAGISEQERCVQQGIVPPALRVIPPAVEKRVEKRGQSPFSASRSIVCIGNLERDAGFRQAIWAFDILCQLFEDAQLHLVGAGAQRSALQDLATGLENPRVHFHGPQADIEETLRSAEIVWVPSLANVGRQVALEAMAQGRAVIASNVPCLRDVILDGQTGCLVPAGDVVALARRTRALFLDSASRDCIGAAARHHVERQYPLGDIVERWRELYRSVAASPLAV